MTVVTAEGKSRTDYPQAQRFGCFKTRHKKKPELNSRCFCGGKPIKTRKLNHHSCGRMMNSLRESALARSAGGVVSNSHEDPHEEDDPVFALFAAHEREQGDSYNNDYDYYNNHPHPQTEPTRSSSSYHHFPTPSSAAVSSQAKSANNGLSFPSPSTHVVSHSRDNGSTNQHSSHPVTYPSVSLSSSSSSPPRSTSDLRRMWRQHGTANSQQLEDLRRHNHHQPNAIRVQIVDACTRYDPAAYTSYIIQVSHQQRTLVQEHRYSDFEKLNQLVQQHNIRLAVPFPPKQLLKGRLFLQRDPSFIPTRKMQLDAWLVHLVHLYNQSSMLPPLLQRYVYDFLLTQPLAPCDTVNQITINKNGSTSTTSHSWNQQHNPWVWTLGAAIRQATHNIQQMTGSSSSSSSIPIDLLQQAQGICCLTIVKAGLIVSGSLGSGLVVAKMKNGMWSAPCAVACVGMGWGAQVGGDLTHVVVVLTTPKAVHDMVTSSSIQLGAELGVAVGPIGRGAHGHLQTGDWSLHPAYAYAHSQGLFVGLSIEGAVVRVRHDVNERFYGRRIQDPSTLLAQIGPRAAEPLYQVLHEALQQELAPGAFRPSQFLMKQERDNNTAYS